MIEERQTPARERRRLPRWAVALVALSLAGFAGLVCGGFALVRALGDGLALEGPQPSTQPEIEALARIAIPPGAGNLRALAGGFQDRFVHVRFDIAPGRLDAFLAGTRYTPQVREGAPVPFQQSLEPDAEWWRPRSAARFLAGQATVDGIAQAVLVDTSDPERYVVYVQTLET